MSALKKILVYGSSGHAKIVASVAQAVGYEVSGYIDDQLEEIKTLQGLPVKPSDEWGLPSFAVALGVGNPRIRKAVFEKLVTTGAELVTVVHPAAHVAPGVKIGMGSVIMAGAIIAVDASVGDGVIVNHNAVVDHDCQVKSFAHICPNATLSGNVIIGEGAWVGAGSTVIQGRQVGPWAMIGAGAAVVKSVDTGNIVVGVPARSTGKSHYFEI